MLSFLTINSFLFILQCSKLCGEGKRHRKVSCFRKENDRIQLLEDSDCEGEVPARSESCMKRPCEGVDWTASVWSGVSCLPIVCVIIF